MKIELFLCPYHEHQVHQWTPPTCAFCGGTKKVTGEVLSMIKLAGCRDYSGTVIFVFKANPNFIQSSHREAIDMYLREL